jgi:hypothetical protein
VALRAELAPAPAAAAATGAKAQFAELSFDFGTVKPTAPQRHDFVVTNNGTTVLVISDVAPGCGCTSAGAWDKEIAPGKSGRIPIEFKPEQFSGKVVKSVVVTTNDLARPTQILELQATVWRPIDIQPTYTSFLPIEGEPRVETKIVHIVNNVDQPAALEVPESSNPQFKTELKTVRPGREFELHISYDSAVPATSLNTAITIKTSLADQPVLTVSAFAMPQPAVVTIPGTVKLPPGPLGPNYIYNIVLRNNSSAPLQVTSPRASVAALGVKLTEPQPGRMFYLSVSIPSDYQASAENPAVVSVKTSHPRFPEIHVPIVPATPPVSAVAAAAK